MSLCLKQNKRMGFSSEIKESMVVLCARHCCVCHRAKGVKVEVHHIIPAAEGGVDTLDNAILLCFDCHADAGHYNPKHPRGINFSPSELQRQKEAWIEKVRDHKIESPPEGNVDLIIRNAPVRYQPIFRVTTTYFDQRDTLKNTFELLGKDIMEFIGEQKKESTSRGFSYGMEKVNSYDDYIDYLNGDLWNVKEDPHVDTSQPFFHEMNFRNMRKMKTRYLANCTLDLVFVNNGPEVLEDYKVYLEFSNISSLDSVNKNT
jgi:hypothetical protein